MFKKRGEKSPVVVMFIILFLIIFIINFVSSIDNFDKIDDKIYDKLKNNDEVRVIVKIDAENNLGQQKAKDEIINDVGEENIKHVFDKEIAVEISKDELNELNNNPNVESVIIDKPIFAFLQESVPYINASLVWPIQVFGINITGIDETVCIIDTGIDFTHPALIGKNKSCIINCITQDCIENCSIGDDNGHGTHVAGIAAASGTINGVAIGANLIGVKVLDSSGSGNGADLYAAIDWCVDNSANYNISIISMSLGDCSNHTTYCNSDDSASHINNAIAKNISVIAAAGNGNSGSCTGITPTVGPSSPACVENAIQQLELLMMQMEVYIIKEELYLNYLLLGLI